MNKSRIYYFVRGISLVLLVLSSLLFIGCDYNKDRTFIINGERVTCRIYTQWNCGMELMDCDNGKEYRCLINVEIIG